MISYIFDQDMSPLYVIFRDIVIGFLILVTIVLWGRLSPTTPTKTKPVTKKKGPIFRVTGLLASDSDASLANALTDFIETLSDESQETVRPTVTIIPSCYDELERMALVEFHSGVPSFLSKLKENRLGNWQENFNNTDINFDQHFFGFTQLYTPSSRSPVTADIIAITALDGHAYGSWRGQGNLGRMWLRDFLAGDLPCCRTMIYGYNSKLSSHGIDTILDYSRELIEELKKIRNTDELRQRPLLFIAHSFGGIILAHCLVKAVQTSEGDHPTTATLYRATYGMLLFGIPHKGLVVNDIQKILDQQGNHDRSQLLEQIRSKSDLLASQLVDFKNLIRDRKIVSFYEMTPTKQLEFDRESNSWKRTGALVTSVEPESALLELPDSVEEKIPLALDHSMMVKFDAKNDKGYTSARDKLKEFAKEASSVVKARFLHHEKRINQFDMPLSQGHVQHYSGSGDNIGRDCFRGSKFGAVYGDLHYTQQVVCDDDLNIEDYFLTKPENDKKDLIFKKGRHASGTCEWILNTTELTTWLNPGHPGLPENQASNVLWLHGNPGTGKSTLAIFLTDRISMDFAQGTNTLAYFFCDSAFDTRKTATSIIRSLLLQLVRKHPQLKRFLPKKDQMERVFGDFNELWTRFLAAAAEHGTGRIYCVVDALDECDPESQQRLLHQLCETVYTPGAPSNISLLVTSRPYPEIREFLEKFEHRDLASFPEAKLDVDRCIEEKVAQLVQKKGYSPKTEKEVREILREKAEGTFLWVGIACNGLMALPSVKAVSYLQDLPSDLHSLYDKLLNTAVNRDAIQCMLRFVAVSLRPFTLLELSEACQVCTNEEDTETRVQYMKDYIESCRLMVISQGEEVLLLHQSVKDYLFKSNEKDDFTELKANAQLAYRCVDHLIKNFFENTHTKSYFSKYAILEWPNHARTAEDEFEVQDTQVEFFQMESLYRESWLSLYRALEYNWDQTPQQFSVLHVAARWGIPAIAEYISRSDNQDHNLQGLACLTNASGQTPLECATRSGYTSIMSILLKMGAVPTREVVLAAAENTTKGKEVMALLLDHRRGEYINMDKVVKEAAGNMGSDAELITLLLDRRGDQIAITEEILKAVAGNWGNSKEVMTLLLDRRGDQITITEEIVKAAAGNGKNGKEVITVLLDRRGDQIAITEEIVKAAAGNRENGKEVMTLLLDRRGDQITITEEIVKAAAGNWGCGKEVITVLLDRRGDQITITEEIVKAAARNWGNGKEVMTLFLDRRGDQITITEEIVKAVAGDWRNSKEVITLFLDRCGDQIAITEEIVKAAAGNTGNGKEVMTLLLDRYGDQTTITEEIVKTAAGNGENGKEVITLLLDRRGDQITITEEIVKAAAGNWGCGKEVMTLLLDRCGDQITITEAVAEVAASCGQEAVLSLFCEKDLSFVLGEWRCIAQFYNAAKEGDVTLVRKLLQEGTKPDTRNIRGETPLWIAAYYGHEDVVKALIQRLDVDVNATSITGRPPIFLSAQCGWEKIVKLLMDAGADPYLEDENGDTAVSVARRHKYRNIVKIFEQS